MIELEDKRRCFGADELEEFCVPERPNAMPMLKEDECVICAFEQDGEERMFHCESLEDMRLLFDSAAGGRKHRITFYIGKDLGYYAHFFT